MHRKLLSLVCVAFWLAGCASNDRETLYQTSTLQALMVGVYDGPCTVGGLRRHGDLGLGTFDGLDGEMVVIDGEVYRVSVDGKIQAMPDDTGVPFANVTFFDVDAEHALPAGMTFEKLPAWLDGRLTSTNLPHAFRIDGTFSYVRTRSVPKQSPPYPPLTTVVKEQRVFEFRDVEGTVLGFRFPSWLKGANVAGYHLHFISADRTRGGHLLAFTASRATVGVDVTPRVVLDLPETAAFMNADTRVKDDAVHAVEKD
jgi:acetolactate decarboxylase